MKLRQAKKIMNRIMAEEWRRRVNGEYTEQGYKDSLASCGYSASQAKRSGDRFHRSLHGLWRAIAECHKQA